MKDKKGFGGAISTPLPVAATHKNEPGSSDSRQRAVFEYAVDGKGRTHALPATICIDLTGYTVVPSFFLGLLGNYAGDSPFARIILIAASDGRMRRLSQLGLLSKKNRLRTVCNHAEAASLIFSGIDYEVLVGAWD